MFSFKFSAFAVSALMLSAASALHLGVPADTTIGATTTVSFTSDPLDPAQFTLYLSKSNQIWAYYGTLATPVDDTAGVVTVTIPAGVDPAPDYVLKAVHVDNFDWVIAQSPTFALTA
ncbi:hypothetical protein BDN70DRAFT_990728 [Pholiota conissans]|uniref:Yeast cell wall synthesis Kre9/Knh1-like N-terminal domain-containing protein n=1 Tax=Pholiota conissans TaxID=109636 RepID=A0A9P6CWH8_9AGAR|nr:hypothetical protein BDN70DRAFT_990728 [Pholiota conissans]